MSVRSRVLTGTDVYADPLFCWMCEEFSQDCVESLCTKCWRTCINWCEVLFTVNIPVGDASYLAIVSPRDDVQEVVQAVRAVHVLTHLLLDRNRGVSKKRRTSGKKKTSLL